MTPRKTLDQMNSDDLDQLHDQLAALRAVARGYCPHCGRGDAAPTVEDWERERDRADEAEERLLRIAEGSPRADAVQAEIGEMIAQTHELRDQLRSAEAAIARVRALHVNGYGLCDECTGSHGVPWPCPTIRALDGKEEPGV